jgi:nicotinate dehydrogenase subunit B
VTNPSIARNPRLGTWVAVGLHGRIVLRTGKVELGQGAVTAIAQMGAHELGVAMADLDIASGDTAVGPDEWYTAGSLSVEVGGQALRLACANAREHLLTRAASRLAVDRLRLNIVESVVLLDGRATDLSPADLLTEIDLQAQVDPSVALRPAGPGGLIGRPLRRMDLRSKIGGAGFIHDTRLSGQLAGRVLRAPNARAALTDVDVGAIRRLPGVVDVLVDGRFVGLVARSEAEAWDAVAQARDLCRWEVPTVYPAAARTQDIFGQLRACSTVRQHSRATVGTVDAELSATYSKPLIAHASIGPSCAVATFTGDAFDVLTHSQGVFALRSALARALEVEESAVHVRHEPGAGCYGHNGADDAALDACLLARCVPGRPVMVTWSREDELTASPFGSPMMTRIRAGLRGGRIVHWSLDVWSGQHGARPGWNGGVNLLAAQQMAKPHPAPEPRDLGPEFGGGGDRNAEALYSVGDHAVTYHFVPDMPFRTSSLRALGSYANLFAIESFMDELAAAARCDAVEFRLRHLDDPRARAVIMEAARLSGWRGGVGRLPERFQGMAFGRYKNKAAYIAVVCEVRVDEDLHVERVWACVDAGCVVNPDGLRNQIEGGLIQSLSWTLMEQVRFSTGRIESDTWETYPILPFSMTPDVEVLVIDHPDQPPLGVGEVAQGPMAAAVANALSAALGLRVRDLPLDRHNIIAATT